MKNALFDLGGRLALVTGSSKGIGHAIARGLLGAGASVVLNARNADTVDAARRELEQEFGEARVSAAVFDVTDREAVTEATDRIGAYLRDSRGMILELWGRSSCSRPSPASGRPSGSCS